MLQKKGAGWSQAKPVSDREGDTRTLYLPPDTPIHWSRLKSDLLLTQTQTIPCQEKTKGEPRSFNE